MPPPPPAQPLSQVYKEYIDAINNRDWHLLSTMIHSEVLWNSKAYSADAYIGLITRGTIPMPDTFFDIDVLVADDVEQRVAARLLIKGIPKEEFLGLKPNGKSVELVEHAFYKFEDGKVREVKTVLDMEGLKEQLA